MLPKNVDLVLSQISDSDIVLDIGGWHKPFNRANYVIDILPYETRGISGSLGGENEFFSKQTWILHDVSSRKPLPFKDKMFDYVICSHTLEDIRDPIFLCSEIVRVGNRGYVEVPSRTCESIFGLEGRHYAGYCHHRWLVEVLNEELVFRFKSHILHESWKYHFPKSLLYKLGEEEKVSSLFWEDSFSFKEVINISYINIKHELEQFVKSKAFYPKNMVLAQMYYYLSDLKYKPKEYIYRILMKSSTLRGFAEKILRKKLVHVKYDYDFWAKQPEIDSR